jgi:F-type H+-transporting ATPase subunit gamma
MAKLLELRQRILAVENIRTITRTLATVAAAKLARTRSRAAGLRVYASRVREILFEQQRALAAAPTPELLRETRPVRSVALLVLTADRGMCGGYNLEVCRVATEFWRRRKELHQEVRLLVKGRRGAHHFARRGAEILHQEGWSREGVGPGDVERLLALTLAAFRSRAADEVWIAYTEFHSPLRYRPLVARMLPVELSPAAASPGPATAWLYEPCRGALLDELLPVYLHVQLYDALLESYASEQGARMITMEEATARADTSLQEYRVQHHRLRREAITVDLLGALVAARSGGEVERSAGGEA